MEKGKGGIKGGIRGGIRGGTRGVTRSARMHSSFNSDHTSIPCPLRFVVRTVNARIAISIRACVAQSVTLAASVAFYC